jgi:hypothetical protein
MMSLGSQGAYDFRLVKDVLAEKDAEIARLRALITELTDALLKANPTDRYRNLIQRARATR